MRVFNEYEYYILEKLLNSEIQSINDKIKYKEALSNKINNVNDSLLLITQCMELYFQLSILNVIKKHGAIFYEDKEFK